MKISKYTYPKQIEYFQKSNRRLVCGAVERFTNPFSANASNEFHTHHLFTIRTEIRDQRQNFFAREGMDALSNIPYR